MRSPTSPRNTRRWRAAMDSAGYVTVEAAFAIGGLVCVACAIVAAIMTVAAYLSAIDAAGAAARAHAIGVEYAPPRGEVAVHASAGLATAVVSVPAPFGKVQATAVFPVETAEAAP